MGSSDPHFINAGLPWSVVDVTDLELAAKRRVAVEEIAELLGRTPTEVFEKMRDLGRG